MGFEVSNRKHSAAAAASRRRHGAVTARDPLRRKVTVKLLLANSLSVHYLACDKARLFITHEKYPAKKLMALLELRNAGSETRSGSAPQAAP